MDTLKWLIPALTGLIQLAMQTLNDAQAAGEMTAAEAQAERDRVNDIWTREYMKTDAQRGRRTTAP